MLFQGHPDYRFSYQDQELEPQEEIKFDPPIEVAPNGIETFVATFKPLTDVPAEGKVVFYTNDTPKPSGILVELKANTEGPCIQVSPKKVQFGGKLVGNKALLPVEIKSCGTADLEISNIILTEGSDADFSLEYSTLPGFEDNSAPTQAKKLTVPGNASAPPPVRQNVRHAPSPRGPQALVLAAKVHALGRGRLHAGFDDIEAFWKPALRHRLPLRLEAVAESVRPDDILDEVLQAVPREPGR